MKFYLKNCLILGLLVAILHAYIVPLSFAEAKADPVQSSLLCPKDEAIVEINLRPECLVPQKTGGKAIVLDASIESLLKPSVVEKNEKSPKKDPGLNPLILFNLVNEYRKKIKLPQLENDGNLCKIAESRLPELQGEIFGGKGMHSGFYKKEISQSGTENLISFSTEKEALNWWLHSFVHKHAIEGNYKYSCVACVGNNCTQLFTNVEQKRKSTS